MQQVWLHAPRSIPDLGRGVLRHQVAKRSGRWETGVVMSVFLLQQDIPARLHDPGMNFSPAGLAGLGALKQKLVGKALDVAIRRETACNG
jgi:hypothetical protein